MWRTLFSTFNYLRLSRGLRVGAVGGEEEDVVGEWLGLVVLCRLHEDPRGDGCARGQGVPNLALQRPVVGGRGWRAKHRNLVGIHF